MCLKLQFLVNKLTFKLFFYLTLVYESKKEYSKTQQEKSNNTYQSALA